MNRDKRIRRRGSESISKGFGFSFRAAVPEAITAISHLQLLFQLEVSFLKQFLLKFKIFENRHFLKLYSYKSLTYSVLASGYLLEAVSVSGGLCLLLGSLVPQLYRASSVSTEAPTSVLFCQTLQPLVSKQGFSKPRMLWAQLPLCRWRFRKAAVLCVLRNSGCAMPPTHKPLLHAWRSFMRHDSLSSHEADETLSLLQAQDPRTRLI